MYEAQPGRARYLCGDGGNSKPGEQGLDLEVGREVSGQPRRPLTPLSRALFQLWAAPGLCHLSLLCTCLHVSPSLAIVLDFLGRHLLPSLPTVPEKVGGPAQTWPGPPAPVTKPLMAILS